MYLYAIFKQRWLHEDYVLEINIAPGRADGPRFMGESLTPVACDIANSLHGDWLG